MYLCLYIGHWSCWLCCVRFNVCIFCTVCDFSVAYSFSNRVGVPFESNRKKAVSVWYWRISTDIQNTLKEYQNKKILEGLVSALQRRSDIESTTNSIGFLKHKNSCRRYGGMVLAWLPSTVWSWVLAESSYPATYSIQKGEPKSSPYIFILIFFTLPQRFRIPYDLWFLSLFPVWRLLMHWIFLCVPDQFLLRWNREKHPWLGILKWLG